MKVIGFTCITVIMFSCAGGAIQGAGTHELQSALEKRDLQSSARMVVKNEALAIETPSELLAQFYLFTCQPQKADLEISFIENEDLQKLYQAVLYALIATPKETEKKSNLKTLLTENVLEQKPEIWADEWDSLNVEIQCTTMPTIGTNKLQRYYQEESLRLFNSLPVSLVTDHWEVLPLALDVGYQLDEPKALEQIKARIVESPARDSGIAKRLESWIGELLQSTDLNVKSQVKNQIELDSVEIKDLKWKTGPGLVPLLLQASPEVLQTKEPS